MIYGPGLGGLTSYVQIPMSTREIRRMNCTRNTKTLMITAELGSTENLNVTIEFYELSVTNRHFGTKDAVRAKAEQSAHFSFEAG